MVAIWQKFDFEETLLEAADGRHFASQRKTQENRNLQINYLKHLQRLKYISKVKNKILNPNLALELTAQRDKQTLYVSMWFFLVTISPWWSRHQNQAAS